MKRVTSDQLVEDARWQVVAVEQCQSVCASDGGIDRRLCNKRQRLLASNGRRMVIRFCFKDIVEP